MYKPSPLAREERVSVPMTWKDRRGGGEGRMSEVKETEKEKMRVEVRV